MSTYKLFNRHEYFDYIIARSHKATAKDTIVVATMEFRPDQEIILKLVEALGAASQKGANVTFLVDAYSFMLKSGAFLGPLFFTKREPKNGYGNFKPTVDAINRMRDQGVNCIITNKPSRALKNPFSGRSHIKYAIFNDEVFIGGCNLSNPEQLDVMARTVNKKLSAYMLDVTQEINTHKNVRKALLGCDVSVKIDDNTQLLIDAGRRKQSLIYDKAFELINTATKRIYMTCQYFPNTYTPAALAGAAERGVSIHLAYNHHDHHPTPIKGIQKHTVVYKKKRLPESLFVNQLHPDKDYLHAKILVSEKEVIVGSHNFVKMGVNLGTAEIALHSTSKEFIKTARDWVEAI